MKGVSNKQSGEVVWLAGFLSVIVEFADGLARDTRRFESLHLSNAPGFPLLDEPEVLIRAPGPSRFKSEFLIQETNYLVFKFSLSEEEYLLCTMPPFQECVGLLNRLAGRLDALPIICLTS